MGSNPTADKLSILPALVSFMQTPEACLLADTQEASAHLRRRAMWNASRSRALARISAKAAATSAHPGFHDSLAERSKAVAQGAIPKGRGFEPHRCHFTLPGFNAPRKLLD